MEWYFSQMKGTTEEDINDADIISCLEFDDTGEFVATGDKGGRIVIFKRNHNVVGRVVDYAVHCTFTSHEPEFDYLKSLEIEEKINKIKWLPQTNESRFLLSTNDKTIKLWRLTERYKRAVGFNFIGTGDYRESMTTRSPLMPLPLSTVVGASGSITSSGIASSGITSSNNNENAENNTATVNGPNLTRSMRQMQLRKLNSSDEIRVPYYVQVTSDSNPIVEATPRRIFSNAHAYHINSISVNSDQQTFLSADDLRINIWNLQTTNQSFNIVDMKPTNMEDLTEVITSSQFHPKSCSLFIYSSSKGIIRLCDMREKALCDNNAITFEEPDDSTSKSFFSEIISSISDIKFSHSGRFILSRDYLTLKIWDMNMSKSPLVTFPVHDYLRMKLCALYENDCIFDKFECCWSPDDRYVLTGSYNNFFRIFDRYSTSVSLNLPNHNADHVNPPCSSDGITLEVGRSLLNCASNQPLPLTSISTEGGHARQPDHLSVDCIDFQKRLLHLAWHPKSDVLALAATNNLFILEAESALVPPTSSNSHGNANSGGNASTTNINSSNIAGSNNIHQIGPPAHSISTTTTTSTTSGYSSVTGSSILPHSTSSIEDDQQHQRTILENS